MPLQSSGDYHADWDQLVGRARFAGRTGPAWRRSPPVAISCRSAHRGRESPNPCDFALVAMLGPLGLRIFEATGADIADFGEEHGHRVLCVCGKGTKVVQAASAYAQAHLRHYQFGCRGSLRGVQIAARHADPALRCATTTLGPARTSTATQLHPRCLHGLRHLTSRVPRRSLRHDRCTGFAVFESLRGA